MTGYNNIHLSRGYPSRNVLQNTQLFHYNHCKHINVIDYKFAFKQRKRNHYMMLTKSHILVTLILHRINVTSLIRTNSPIGTDLLLLRIVILS